MPAYDAKLFDPPAPVAPVTLRNTADRRSLSSVPMLIDTGADVTLIPRDMAAQLGVGIVAGLSYELVLFDGSSREAQAVELDLVFMNRVFRGRFLLLEESWGVLGRDVLNHISLVLDGPALTWSEVRPKA